VAISFPSNVTSLDTVPGNTSLNFIAPWFRWLAMMSVTFVRSDDVTVLSLGNRTLCLPFVDLAAFTSNLPTFRYIVVTYESFVVDPTVLSDSRTIFAVTGTNTVGSMTFDDLPRIRFLVLAYSGSSTSITKLNVCRGTRTSFGLTDS